MKTIRVEVTRIIDVTVDETKFDETFMDEFRQSFFPFYEVDEHAMHIAQMYARGVIENGDFIEGYGPANDMGISMKNVEGWEEVVPS
jgi:hypothetical protein